MMNRIERLEREAAGRGCRECESLLIVLSRAEIEAHKREGKPVVCRVCGKARPGKIIERELWDAI